MANALSRDIPAGAVIQIKASAFSKRHPPEARRVVVSGDHGGPLGDGFGCAALCSGQAIFGKWQKTGERVRVEGYQIEKIVSVP